MTVVPFDLKGRTALVTGGASGIGAAVVELLVSLGVTVCSTDIVGGDDDLRGDVASATDVGRITSAALARMGTIDVLVNSAGIAETLVPTVEQTPQAWQRVIDINLTGTFLMCQAVGAGMVARKRGAIINIASIVGLGGFPRRNAYGAGKAAIINLTRSLASEWGGSGVRVNCVAPGYIRTPMVVTLVEEKKLDVGRLERRTPLGRLGDPGEIAQAIAYLASDWASYVNGATLAVDGGWSAFGGAGDVATA